MISAQQQIRQNYQDSIEQNELLKTNNLKCIMGKHAVSLCTNQSCQQKGVICYQHECLCNQQHRNCDSARLNSILQLVAKRINKQKSLRHQFQTYLDAIQQLSQLATDLKAQIQIQSKYPGLLEQQAKYLFTIIDDGKLKNIAFPQRLQINGKNNYQFLQSLRHKERQKYIIQQYAYNLHRKVQYNVQQIGKIARSIKNICIAKVPRTMIKQNKEIPKLTKKLIQDKQIHLDRWIEQSTFKTPTYYRLLFRASEHQFSAFQFHKSCDNVKYTVSLIKTLEQKLIGGFASCPWNSCKTGGFSFNQQQPSFLFSFTMKDNKNQRIQCTQKEFSMQCCNQAGPVFGNHDIYISDGANINQSFSFFPNTFKRYENKRINEKQDLKAFIGKQGNKFLVSEYQIYQVVF